MNNHAASVSEKILLAEKLTTDMENFCFHKYGISILSEDEKIKERKRLREEIIRESKNKPPINSKKLLKETKQLVTLLEKDIL